MGIMVVMGITAIADIMAMGITEGIAGIMGMDTIVRIIIVMVTTAIIQDTEIGIITVATAAIKE
jgi:hypothetical protein